MESHDLIGEFGGSVDSLPSDVSEVVARKEKSKQLFLRVNLDWEASLGNQPSYNYVHFLWKGLAYTVFAVIKAPEKIIRPLRGACIRT